MAEYVQQIRARTYVGVIRSKVFLNQRSMKKDGIVPRLLTFGFP